MELHPCRVCARHVAVRETSCPFCATELRTADLARAARHNLPLGHWSRAAVFGAATLAAACGGKARPAGEYRQQNHGGGGCADPDPSEIARLEKQRDEAKTDDEKHAIAGQLQQARMPVCQPYGAPPARRRLV